MTTLAAAFPIRAATIERLGLAGIAVSPNECAPGEDCLRGFVYDPGATRRILDGDPQHWQPQGIRSGYHEELGPDRLEWREWYDELTGVGAFGLPGTCQFTLNPHTGEIRADIDRANPEQSVWGLFQHGFGKDDGLSIRKFGRWVWRKLRGK